MLPYSSQEKSSQNGGTTQDNEIKTGRKYKVLYHNNSDAFLFVCHWA